MFAGAFTRKSPKLSNAQSQVPKIYMHLSPECLNIVTCTSIIRMYVWKGCTSSCVWLCVYHFVYGNSKSSQGRPECPTLGTVLSPLLQM